MSNSKTARRRIRALALELRAAKQTQSAEKLERIVNELMYRRSAARRMNSHSQPITPHIVRQVRDLARTTSLHSAEIAARLNINPGRVSEILQGDR
jgi:hypothetical protein